MATYILPLSELTAFLTHIQEAYPREASGVLLVREWRRFSILFFAGTSHMENTSTSFRIRDSAIKEIADSPRFENAQVCGCAHSHTLGRAFPSRQDIAAEKGACLLWMIYSVPRRDIRLFSWGGDSFRGERIRIVS